MAPEQIEVVVVGTGWNGLIGAKTYLELKPDANLVLLDEQASIGGVWNRESIYPSLFAQIKYGLFEYSFYPMRREGITADGYISGETINRYLNDFARDYDLVRRTRLRTRVAWVERRAGGGWRLELDGGKPAIECAKLIYASGATSHPVVPSWPRSPDFQAPVIHSSETGLRLETLSKIRRATVVGAAKSAYDTVFLLLRDGVQVDWVIRKDGSGPLAIMPPTILGVVNSMDVISTRAMAMFGPSIMAAKGPAYRFFQTSWPGRFLAALFWLVVNLIAELHAGYANSTNAQRLRPLPHGNGIFWAMAGLGCASVPDFWKVFHAGNCRVHRTEIASLGDGKGEGEDEGGNKNKINTVTLRDGTRFETDYVILCTGFDKSYHAFSRALQHELGLAPDPADERGRERWAELDARAERTVDALFPALRRPPPVPPGMPGGLEEQADGNPHGDGRFGFGGGGSEKEGQGQQREAGRKAEKERDEEKEKVQHGPSRHYRRLVVPGLAARGDRSVYFPGFIHSIYTPLVSEVQALWGCAFLLGLHGRPPSLAAMETEVAEWNAWSRRRYIVQGRKHAYAIYDFLSYIDTLLSDLGINTVRRTNPLAELFLPMYPRLYHGLVDELRAARATRQRDDMSGGGDSDGEMPDLLAGYKDEHGRLPN